jgi:hypothetical protein
MSQNTRYTWLGTLAFFAMIFFAKVFMEVMLEQGPPSGPTALGFVAITLLAGGILVHRLAYLKKRASGWTTAVSKKPEL